MKYMGIMKDHLCCVMSFAIVQRGDLTLIKRDNGKQKIVHTGEALSER